MGFGIMGVVLLIFGWITSIATDAEQEMGNSDKEETICSGISSVENQEPR